MQIYLYLLYEPKYTEHLNFGKTANSLGATKLCNSRGNVAWPYDKTTCLVWTLKFMLQS